MAVTPATLAGAWRELGREFVGADGSVTADVARLSQILYSADGYMSVVNAPKERAVHAQAPGATTLDSLSEAQRAETAHGVVAYAGHYEIEGDVVFHVIYTALNPTMIGVRQKRHARIDGDVLTLASPPDAAGRFFRIRWQRADKM